MAFVDSEALTRFIPVIRLATYGNYGIGQAGIKRIVIFGPARVAATASGAPAVSVWSPPIPLCAGFSCSREAWGFFLLRAREGFWFLGVPLTVTFPAEPDDLKRFTVVGVGAFDIFCRSTERADGSTL